MSEKWKIQTVVPGGWGDIKVNVEGSDKYTDDHYPTRAEARSEMRAIVDGTDAGRGEYRVVRASVPQDMDLYD